jgi:hypothetical protein
MSSWGKRALSLIMALIFVFALLPGLITPVKALYTFDSMTTNRDGLVEWGDVSGVTKWVVTVKGETVQESTARSFDLKAWLDNKYGSSDDKYGNWVVSVAGYKDGTKITNAATQTWFYEDPDYVEPEPEPEKMLRPERVRWDGRYLRWDIPEEYKDKDVQFKITSIRIYAHEVGSNPTSKGRYLTMWNNGFHLDFDFDSENINWICSGELRSWPGYGDLPIVLDPGVTSFDFTELYRQEFIQSYCRELPNPLTGVEAHVCTVGRDGLADSWNTSNGIRWDFDRAAEWKASPVQLRGEARLESVPIVGQKVTFLYGGELGAGRYYSACDIQWQRASSPDATTWEDISGATGTSYTLQDWDLGDYIRVKLTVRKDQEWVVGRNGYVVSDAQQVVKMTNWEYPVPPILQQSGTTLKLTNYKADQEYYVTTNRPNHPYQNSALMSESPWNNTYVPAQSSDGSVTLTNTNYGRYYYIYTRFKETDTKRRGEILRESSCWLGDAATVSSLNLEWTNLTHPDSGYVARIGDVLKVTANCDASGSAYQGINRWVISKGSNYATIYEDQACTTEISSGKYYNTVYVKVKAQPSDGLPVSVTARIDKSDSITLPGGESSLVAYATYYTADENGNAYAAFVTVPDFNVTEGAISSDVPCTLIPAGGMLDATSVFAVCQGAGQSVNFYKAPAVYFSENADGEIWLNADATYSPADFYDFKLYKNGIELTPYSFRVTVQEGQTEPESFEVKSEYVSLYQNCGSYDMKDFVDYYPLGTKPKGSTDPIYWTSTTLPDNFTFYQQSNNISGLSVGWAEIGSTVTFTGTLGDTTRSFTVEVVKHPDSPTFSTNLPGFMQVKHGETVELPVACFEDDVTFQWRHGSTPPYAMGEHKNDPTYIVTGGAGSNTVPTPYYCIVTRAVNGEECSATSNNCYVWSYDDLPVPVISSTPYDETKAQISWSWTQENPYCYQLFASDRENGVYTKVRDGISPSTASVTETVGDEAGDNIWFRIRGVYKDGDGKYTYSPFSDPLKCVSTTTGKPTITTQPADKTAAAGATATFNVVASGTGLTYQWQYKTAGSSTWHDKTGATSASYTVTAKESYNGIQYRCKVSNAVGSVTSNPATLTVTVTETAPAITTQPKAQTAAAGEAATFKVVATGGNLSYQWQYSTDYGKTWHDKTGSTKATHTVTVKASYNGYLYRCKVSNSKGTVTSSKVRLTVSGVKPRILSQPAAKTAEAGESVTFKVVAAGVGMTYQWQYSKNGTTWTNKAGATSASYTVTAKESYNGMLYRCIVTNAGGSVTSGTAKLTVTVAKPVITTQPKAATAAVGATATYKVVASGTGLTYQWQYSNDYGATWHNKSGATSASYTVTAKASYNGMLYRCRVKNSGGTVYSSKVRLTVSGVKPKVLSQPKAATAAAGGTATFKVVAAGENMIYQWQYSTDGGTTWKNKTGATSASYTVTAKASYNGILYRCRVKNSYGTVYSESAKLTVS